MLLSGLAPVALSAYLAHVQMNVFTPQTITSKAKLRREIEVVRKQGYALDIEEFAENLCCISVPVKDPHNGAVVAAISVAMPKHRFRRALVGRWRRQLEEKAALLSPQLAFIDA